LAYYNREKDDASKNCQRSSSAMEEGTPNDILRLDVGGTCLKVLRRTLTQVEGSMLATRFSGRSDASLEKNPDGSIFVDQPIEIFRPLVNLLKAKAIETPGHEKPSLTVEAFGNDRTLYLDFMRMIEHYGLTEALYPIKVCQHQIDFTGCNEIVLDAYAPHMRFSSTYMATSYVLRAPYHISSFEIVVEKFDEDSDASLFVGWIHPTSESERFSSVLHNWEGRVLCGRDRMLSDDGKVVQGWESVPKDWVPCFGGRGKWVVSKVTSET
jgi:hypothetical protein